MTVKKLRATIKLSLDIYFLIIAMQGSNDRNCTCVDGVPGIGSESTAKNSELAFVKSIVIVSS